VNASTLTSEPHGSAVPHRLAEDRPAAARTQGEAQAMTGPDGGPRPRSGAPGTAAAARLIRAVAIRWRIFAVGVLHSLLSLVLVFTVWNGASELAESWRGLKDARESEQLLVALESDTGRLQNLIHRYFNQPNPSVLAEIETRRAGLVERLQGQPRTDAETATQSARLALLMERFLKGFDDLRTVRAAISATYEGDVLRPAREMAELYARIDADPRGPGGTIAAPLGQSREAFNRTLLAANAYYLSLSRAAGEEARANVAMIERIAPAMIEAAAGESQRGAATALRYSASALREGLELLTEHFNTQELLLRQAVDENAAGMSTLVDQMTRVMQARERDAQTRFDDTLNGVYTRIGVAAGCFLIAVFVFGVPITRSISEPLGELRGAMNEIVEGRIDTPVEGTEARDELGDMARAVEVFRENAVARREAEAELQAAKVRAETALAELRDTQESLIEAEKLAALGSLVAGVAHEVNNPVGISLTVASSLARRSEAFEREIGEGQLRRSRLVEFVAANREASKQLVANLQRAGELVQSFKQVAVDRSQAERRVFDLADTSEQIVQSLRPGLKKAQVQLTLSVPPGIALDGYPGPYGQVLTNLCLNAATHAFGETRPGNVSITARTLGTDQVEITVSDDGVGMTDEVQRHAFDPFFTTRRGQGGTGLGLHIVYNIVTRRLGGRITLLSHQGLGTTFRITLPLVAPREGADDDHHRT